MYGPFTDGGRYIDTRLETNYLDTLFTAEAPEHFPSEVSVSFFVGQVQLTIGLVPERLMRRRTNEVHDEHIANYLR